MYIIIEEVSVISVIYTIVSGGFIVGTNTHVYANFEDTKGVIIVIHRKTDNTIAKSKKGQIDKLPSTNNTQKSKDRAIRTPLKQELNRVLRKGRQFYLH